MKRVMLGVVLAFVVAVSVGCSAPQQQQWGQGYEAQNGYMQPDHGWFYYWMLYHATVGMYEPRPTYHIYIPPAGYPREYRPWRNVQSYSGYPYDRAPKPVKPASGATPARTSGGFSTPAPKPQDNRSTGGFAKPAAAPPPASRTSGGFSSPNPPPAPPKAQPRTSGGFSRSKR